MNTARSAPPHLLADERVNRGPEVPPTRAVLLTGSFVQVMLWAAAGCGILLALHPIAAIIARLMFPEAPFDFLALLGGSLIAAAGGIASFLLLAGFAQTAHWLALARMYSRCNAAARVLRNTVEVRGPVPASPFFPAMVSIAVIGLTMVSTAGIFAAAQVWPHLTVIGAAVATVCVAVFFAFRFLNTRWRRRAVGRLPRGSFGEQGSARLFVADRDRELHRRIRERTRRERTGLDYAAIGAGVLLVAGIATAMVSPAVAAPLRGLGIGLAFFGMIAIVAVSVASQWQLTRTLARIRTGGAEITARDRAHARAATAKRTSGVRSLSAAWSALGAGALGYALTHHDGATLAPLAIAAFWTIGFVMLVWLWMKTDAAGPKLREEFGYRLPLAFPSASSTQGI